MEAWFDLGQSGTLEGTWSEQINPLLPRPWQQELSSFAPPHTLQGEAALRGVRW